MRLAWSWLAAVLAAGVAADAADDPWDGPAFGAAADAVARAAQATPLDPSLAVRVLLNETELRFEADGRCTRRERLVYRVESDDARDSWDRIEVVWAPWHQARPDVRARVVASDGREAFLDPSTVLESGVGETDDEVFSDRRQLTAPLPALVPGSVVEQETVIRDQAPWFPAGTVTRLYLATSAPTRRARIVIDAPAALPTRWSAQLLPGLEPRRDEAGGRVRLTFELSDVPPFESPETGLPPDVSRWPHVAVSTGASWAEVARGYAALVEQQLKGADVSALAREAGGAARDRRVAIQRLLARVDGVRYTSVQLGDAAFVPRTPKEVLARGYGDCKDKATLLVALLRASGVQASVALLNSGYGEDLPPDLPGLGQFNHAIVHVPGPPAMWIDPTVERSRAGELPLNDQGRRALVAAPDTHGLVTTPESADADNGMVETREFHLAELGPSRVLESTDYRGAYERHYRREAGSGDAAKRREQVQDYVRQEYLADSLGAFEEGPADDLEKPFRIRAEAIKARRGATDEKEAVVAYFPGRVASELPDVFAAGDDKEPPPERKGPFYFASPHFVEHRYRIVAPPGYAIAGLPDAEDLPMGAARYRATWTRESDTVVSGTLRLETGPRRITADQFRQMRDAVRVLRARPVAFVRFTQTGEAHLAAGRVREALAEFAALSERHPREALHRTQTALAMLAGGLGEAARAEARRAVEVEPGSAHAHRSLGWVLQHDLVGRRLAPGADVPAAQAAYAKAVELDAEDVVARTNLAYLLEFDAHAERYGPGSRLTEAAEQYWRLARIDKQPYFDLVLVLLRSGRFGEMAEAAGLLTDASQRNAMEVLAASAQDGVKAGIARAARIARPEDRRRALQEAADQLLRIRRYADAAALLHEAAQGAPNASALRARADLVARVRVHQASDEVEAGVDGLVRTFVRALVFGWPEARVLELFHPDERGPQGPTEQDQLAVVRSMFDHERRKVSMPADVFADLTLSILETAAEGDDRFGYRVRFRGPQAALIPILYVVPNGDGLRILGSAANLDALGREALRRADAHDVEGARRVLDWAREETSAEGEDPFGGPPFVRFWSVGQKRSLDAIRVAAASLLVAVPHRAEQGVQILQAARGGARDDAERAHFDRAIGTGYATLERWPDALAAVDRLAERLESSAALRGARGFLLFRLGRHVELQHAAEERLRSHPSDLEAARLLRLALVARKDYAAVDRQCGPMLDSGRANANDYNDCAWITLFLPPPRTVGIERARRSVEMARSQQPRAYMHTLGSLYASEEQTSEAYGIMLEAMTVGRDDEPRAEDWFVFGRMAESYGLADAAATAYRRVRESDDPSSTWFLARERLAGLAAATKRSPGGPRRPGRATRQWTGAPGVDTKR